MAGQKKAASIDAETADRLLDLLGSNDEFRSEFQSNPVAALQSIGYQPADSLGLEASSELLASPFSACSVIQLASKELILEAKAELKAALVQGLAYNTPTFEAETLERRTRK
jgi:putative modified peptide